MSRRPRFLVWAYYNKVRAELYNLGYSRIELPQFMAKGNQGFGP